MCRSETDRTAVVWGIRYFGGDMSVIESIDIDDISCGSGVCVARYYPLSSTPSRTPSVSFCSTPIYNLCPFPSNVCTNMHSLFSLFLFSYPHQQYYPRHYDLPYYHQSCRPKYRLLPHHQYHPRIHQKYHQHYHQINRRFSYPKYRIPSHW